MANGQMGSMMGQLLQGRQRQQGPRQFNAAQMAQMGVPRQPQQQGLPPGIDPRAVAANPQGFARQQAQLQQAGGDPRRAAMMQQLQQRMGQRQAGGGMGQGGQQGLLGRMLAGRGAQGRQGRMRQPGSPRRTLMRRRMGRMAGMRQRLQKRLAQR